MSTQVICVICLLLYVFFFFKQKTAYEMRISDWSSDVCSSDLHALDDLGEIAGGILRRLQAELGAAGRGEAVDPRLDGTIGEGVDMQHGDLEIGRASCRERVCQYV